MCYFGGKVSEVFGFTTRRLVKIQAEDNAMALIKFKSGALGNIEVTTAARPKDLEGSISILEKKVPLSLVVLLQIKLMYGNFKTKNFEIKKKIYAEPIQCIWI